MWCHEKDGRVSQRGRDRRRKKGRTVLALVATDSGVRVRRVPLAVWGGGAIVKEAKLILSLPRFPFLAGVKRREGGLAAVPGVCYIALPPRLEKPSSVLPYACPLSSRHRA